MANQSLENVKGLMKNKSTRVVLFLTFGAIGAAFVVAGMSTSNQQSRPKELQAAVGTPNAPTMAVTPGTSDNPLHNEKVRQMNREKAEEAQRTGESTVPRLTNPNGDKEKDPFDLVQNKPIGQARPSDPTVPAPNPVNRPGAVAGPVTPMAAPQPVAKSQGQIQAERDMSAAIAGLLNSWNPAPQKIEIDYAGSKNMGSQNSQAASAAAGGATAQNASLATTTATAGVLDASGSSTTAVAKKVSIKAGSILHAVMLTSVNSDEPGPVLAQVTTGPYAGGRLIGKFELAKDAGKMVLTFTTLTMQNADKSYQLSGYAVDPETARTALASDVDRHYLSRYGAFSAATFLKGYAQALAQSGSTQTVNAGAAGISSTTSYPTLDNKKIAITALGSLGGELGTQLKDGLKRPPTVTLNTGTEIGVLVMQDTSF